MCPTFRIGNRSGDSHELGYLLRFCYWMNVGAVAGQPVAKYDRELQRGKSQRNDKD